MPDDAGAVSAAIPSDDLCLAYVNTRYWRGTPVPTEELHAIADVTSWLAKAAPASAGMAESHAAHWRANPAEGAIAHSAAVALRETLHRALSDTAAGKPASLSGLNLALAQAVPRQRLLCEGGGVAWEMPPGPPSAARLLSCVVWSAADLITGPRQSRLRACANPKCGWLFLDDSKSANRRWCAMSACGNRAKAQRHYQRAKAARQAPVA